MNDSFAGTNVRKTNNVTDTHHSLSLSSNFAVHVLIKTLSPAYYTLKSLSKSKSKLAQFFLNFFFLSPFLSKHKFQTPISHLFINHSQDFYEEFPHLCFFLFGIAQFVMSLEF